MRNLLALIGALVIGFAVVGWYLNWYELGVTKAQDGNLRVETNLNTQKVVDDSGAAIKKAGTLVGNQIEQSKNGEQPTPGTTPGPQDPKKVTLFGFDLSPAQKK